MANTDRTPTLEDCIPTAHQVQLDVLEWWCHVILQDCSSPKLYAQRVEGFKSVLQDLGEDVMDYGRVYNRTQLAVLCADLTNRPIVLDDEDYDDDDDEEDEEDKEEALSNLASEAWAEYRQSLEEVRSDLLRKDADYKEQDEEDDSVDDVLEALPKFSQDYQVVMTLLKLHEVAAAFQQKLNKLQTSRAQKTLLVKVETAVAEYKEGIKDLALDDETTNALTSFLLSDLYRKKAKDLPHELVQHVSDILRNDENDFSYGQVCGKVRRLLQRWHSHVLSTPKLCRLGYGGFTKRKSSICVDDNVSVSSWGIDQEEAKERQQVVAATEEEQKEEERGGGAFGSEDSTTEEGYATARSKGDDDETADEEAVRTAFDFSTQPPIPQSQTQDDEEVDDDGRDDGHKKPRAKRKQGDDDDETIEDDDGAVDSESKTPKAQGATTTSSRPRRSLRTSPPQSPRRRMTRTAAVAAAAASAEAEKSDEDEDEEMIHTQPETTSPAAVAERRSKAYDEERIPVPDESRQTKAPSASVARKPPSLAAAQEEEDSSSGSESSAVAPPPPPPSSPRPPARRHARAPLARAKNPTVIEWDTDSDEDVSEPDLHPPAAKRARRSSSSWTGGDKRKKATPSRKKTKARRRFTEEEKQAIRDGVERFGEGKWALIRLNSNGILMSRTNVNIKDCYRNMLNRGNV